MREYLKELRSKQHMSQQEVADKIGISQNYYTYIEAGERQKEIKLDTLIKLAKVFNVTTNQLIKAETEYKK